MKISNETKVGALTSIAIAILFIGYSFLKGNNVFSSENTFYTEYDNVDGSPYLNPYWSADFKSAGYQLSNFNRTEKSEQSSK